MLILVCDLPPRYYKKPATYCTLRTETGDIHIWLVGCLPHPFLKIKQQLKMLRLDSLIIMVNLSGIKVWRLKCPGEKLRSFARGAETSVKKGKNKRKCIMEFLRNIMHQDKAFNVRSCLTVEGSRGSELLSGTQSGTHTFGLSWSLRGLRKSKVGWIVVGSNQLIGAKL